MRVRRVWDRVENLIVHLCHFFGVIAKSFEKKNNEIPGSSTLCLRPGAVKREQVQTQKVQNCQQKQMKIQVVEIFFS